MLLGLGQSDGDPVRGDELLGRARLHRDGQVLQGARRLWIVGLLRRVQPDRPRGIYLSYLYLCLAIYCTYTRSTQY